MIESTILNNDVKNQIRTLYLQGKEYKQIREILKIKEGTWDGYYYENKYGFRDFINDIKKEYFIREAERFSRKLLALEDSEDARIYALKQKETEFLRETLGKDIYSKKTEIDQQQPITINVNSLKDRLTEPIDTQPKQLDNSVAQYTLSPQSDSGNTTPLIENDVKQLTDKE